MGSVAVTIEKMVEGVGPRGGDANGTKRPGCRRAELNDGETGLHRFQDTATAGWKNERPWHRLAAVLMVQGKSNRHIAELAGVTEVTVSCLNAQLWFQQLKARLTNEVAASLSDRFQAEAATSLNVLVQLRDTSENERVVANVSQYILDQACGKATQKVVSVNASTTFKSEQEEFDAIQRELQALRGIDTRKSGAAGSDEPLVVLPVDSDESAVSSQAVGLDEKVLPVVGLDEPLVVLNNPEHDTGVQQTTETPISPDEPIRRVGQTSGLTISPACWDDPQSQPNNKVNASNP